MRRARNGAGIALGLVSFGLGGCPDKGKGGGGGGDVTVTVFEDGNPAAGYTVLFHDHDGELLAELTTDSSGQVTFDTPKNGMATVVRGSSSDLDLQTIGGLRGGEDLVYRFGIEGATTIGVIDVAAAGSVATATEYQFVTPCYSSPVVTTSATLTFYSDCVDASGNTDILAFALSPSGDPLAYAFASGVPAASTPSLALPAWSTAFDTATIGVSGLPAAVTGAGARISAFGAGGAYDIGDTGGAPVSGAVSMSIPTVPGFGSGGSLTTLLGRNDGRIAIRVEGLASLSGNTSYVFADDYLPFYENVVVSTSLAATRPVVSWDHAAADIDAIGVLADWDDYPSAYASWTLILPPSRAAGGATFPALPSSISSMFPSVSPSAGVFSYDVGSADSFSEFLEILMSEEISFESLPPGESIRATFNGAL